MINTQYTMYIASKQQAFDLLGLISCRWPMVMVKLFVENPEYIHI